MVTILQTGTAVTDTVADLGFGKGACPIHQKGALEEAKPQTCAPENMKI